VQQLHQASTLDTAARVTTSLRASLQGLPANTRRRLTMNLAINQHAQRRNRTNVCMCHLDHLLHFAVDSSPTRAAHRSRAPKLSLKNDFDWRASKAFSGPRYPESATTLGWRHGFTAKGKYSGSLEDVEQLMLTYVRGDLRARARRWNAFTDNLERPGFASDAWRRRTKVRFGRCSRLG
jgi:hypothetical protein